jgi:hypothetical protein
MNSTCLIHPTLHPTARRVYILTTGCPTSWMNYAISAVQPANQQQAANDVTCVDIEPHRTIIKNEKGSYQPISWLLEQVAGNHVTRDYGE